MLRATDRVRRRYTVALGIASVACMAVAAFVIAAPEAIGARPGGGGGLVFGSGPAPTVAQPVVTTAADAGPFNPAQPFELKVQDGTLAGVTVTDGSGKAVAGTLAGSGAAWTATVPLAYATTYKVGFDVVGSDGTRQHQERTVSTIAPQQQIYPSFIPPPSQTSVGVGQPIVVRFDHPVHDRAAAQRALTVTADPPQNGGWYWLSDSEVHYRPEVYWQPGTTITLKASLFGVDLGQGAFGQTDRTETIHVHDAWVAKADGKSETMQIFDNDKLVNTMPISLGSPGHPSHVGPHVISDKQPSITMDSCTYGVCQGQPGYYKEQVNLDERISNDGEFVHSAPWSVGSQGGANVSHGCVNLSPANAQWFFDRFGIGDVVEITNSGGPTLPIDDTYGDWELTWAQWQAGSAA